MIQQELYNTLWQKKRCVFRHYVIKLISKLVNTYVLTLNITHGLTENMFQQIDQKHRTQKYF
jgi:hypothetical protein